MSGIRQFLTELSEELAFHPEQDGIIEEYREHVEEMAEDMDAPPSYEVLVSQMGAPQTIASEWKEESTVTEPRLQWLFVFCNGLLFVGGGLLTLGFHLFEWRWLQWTWHTLTSIPMVIVIVYFAFWSLLGYEVGKAFGARGVRLLRKTFAFGMVPNLSLMVLIIFQIIPQRWFDPLITKEFILICVVSTILLYPVSWVGYRWGRRMSIL